MIDRVADREIKICCATFYASDAVRMLLGDVLHPGGLDLTYHLGQVLELSEGDRVLDVACGRGASVVHLAQRFGCHVTGLDYGPENVAAARESAAGLGVSHLTAFRIGDAEGLPFDEASFDAVISECSYCTFPDKARASAEMVRVLRPGGRVGLTDITMTGDLPDDMQTLLAWLACVAGAGTSEHYTALLADAGFGGFVVEDHGEALRVLVNNVRLKLMAAELAAALGKVNLSDIDLSEAKRLARRAMEQIDAGALGYALVAARKD
jgi:ubiquinone/menaquinone biosynthesis C-methylase UbiE